MFPLGTTLKTARVNPEDCYVPDYAHFNWDVCKEYKESLEMNPQADLACIYVVEREFGGKHYKVYDGRHRHMAYTMNKRNEIPVIIVTLPF